MAVAFHGGYGAAIHGGDGFAVATGAATASAASAMGASIPLRLRTWDLAWLPSTPSDFYSPWYYYYPSSFGYGDYGYGGGYGGYGDGGYGYGGDGGGGDPSATGGDAWSQESAAQSACGRRLGSNGPLRPLRLERGPVALPLGRQRLLIAYGAA